MTYEQGFVIIWMLAVIIALGVWEIYLMSTHRHPEVTPVPPEEDQEPEEVEERTMPLAVDPENPPKPFIYPANPKPGVPTRCECHDEPLRAGDKVILWPDAKQKGVVHMLCERAGQVG